MIVDRLRRRGTTSAVVLCLLILSLTLLPRPAARAHASSTHALTWDSHSLSIDGKRIFLYSGEFHYWRLPARELWTDRLEKMKAAGLNAVSIYFDWQFHSSAPGQYDFTGIRDVDYLLTLAQQIGLYVIARVGPYMNAEVDAGGLPGWVLTKPLFPRAQSWNGRVAQAQDSPLYTQYSKEWYDHLLPILARHQVTTGGSVVLLSVENEYNQATGSPQYMQDLIHFARADGITVPIFHNDFYFKGDWKDIVDLYAYDSYPYGFNCCHQWYDLHFHGIDSWEPTLRNALKVTTPMFVSEIQGGAFQPWGGHGYEDVAKTLDGDWLSPLDESAFAQGATILNTYMFAGGTTWGYMTEPGVYTSYDYGAAIGEAGQLRPSYYSAHRLGMFLQTYGPLLAAAQAIPSPSAPGTGVVVHTRVDPGSGTVFTFLRHGDPGEPIRTKLELYLNGRTIQVPQKPRAKIIIPGHGSEMLVANVDTGPLHMNYSTSQVLTDTTTALGHYLVLYGSKGSAGETDFALPPGPLSIEHNGGVSVARSSSELRLDYRHTIQPRTVSIRTAGGTLRLIITTTQRASYYWTAGDLLVSGPELVEPAARGYQMSVSRPTDVTTYGAPTDDSLTIDGQETAAPEAYMGMTLLGRLRGPGTIPLPGLGTWKFQAEAPEIKPSFDDSTWQIADHTTTTNPNAPSNSGLLADDYGFHYGFVWYRGHFTATGRETGISIAARQSYSVYINGVYAGSGDESLAPPPHPYAAIRTFSFPSGVLKPGQNNVVAVLVESLGHDEGWIAGPAAQTPQGIIEVQLQGVPTGITWRIQGDAGGEHPADTERGLMNASGLFGERSGWYAPAFDDSHWQPVSLPDNWQKRAQRAPVGWYRTHFQLSIPNSTDAAIGLVIPHASDKAAIWLNGWLIGRYWEQQGPQHRFFLPNGILHLHGDNVLAIAVWNRGHSGGLSAAPYLFSYSEEALHTLGPGAALTPSRPDYWHTDGIRIVDSAGRPVRIAAVIWGGLQTGAYVPSGLNRQPLSAIMHHIHSLGFNTVRLPFSNQLVEQNPIIHANLDANPSLRGLHALDILDRIIAAAKTAGIRIILDNHRSDIGSDPEENGLWYTPRYPEQNWIADWKLLAARYKGNATVVGVDLRDEPHTEPPGPWSLKTYLHQGATWGPYDGIENTRTDWRLAAQRGGNAVLSVNASLLVFVEGLQQYPDPGQPNGIDSYWWGGIFQPAARYPLALSISHQLVYSPHEYGPFKYQMPFFGPHMSYRSLTRIWQEHWGFLERSNYAQRAPIFIGEFGTCGRSPACVTNTTPGSQGLWFTYFMRYLRTHPEINWGFWSLNGTNSAGADQPNYVFKSDWKSVRLHQLIDSLRDVEVPPPPGRSND